MDFFNEHFGVAPLLKCRGTIGTTELNVNALAVSIRYNVQFAVADRVEVASASTADTAAGTGARTIKVYGLDKDYNPQIETIVMNGQTPVVGTLNFIRVFAAYVATAGTGTVNAGNIHVIRQGTGGTYTGGVPGTLTSAWIRMLAGDNLGYSGVFTPARNTLYRVASIVPTSRAQGGTIIAVRNAPLDTDQPGPFAWLKIESQFGIARHDMGNGMILQPREDLYFRAISAAAGGIHHVMATLERI